jgi:ribosomal protein S27E
MAGTQVLSVLAIRCAACGDTERVITVTADQVISRCYVCGDAVVRRRGRAAQARPAVRHTRPDGWPARSGPALA